MGSCKGSGTGQWVVSDERLPLSAYVETRFSYLGAWTSGLGERHSSGRVMWLTLVVCG